MAALGCKLPHTFGRRGSPKYSAQPAFIQLNARHARRFTVRHIGYGGGNRRRDATRRATHATTRLTIAHTQCVARRAIKSSGTGRLLHLRTQLNQPFERTQYRLHPHLARLPTNCALCVRTCVLPISSRHAHAKHTVPTGLSAVPPLGPAMPLTATTQSVRIKRKHHRPSAPPWFH